MQSKGFLAIIGVLIAVTIGVILFANRSNEPGNTQVAAEIATTDHIRGKADSPVTLIEYGDFQCPVCKQYDPLMFQLFILYNDKVRFVYRHFPLSRIHTNAIAAARAAEAAGNQNAFFEMGSLMFENQDAWANNDSPAPFFEGLAAQLGLDVEKFKTDSAAAATLEIINGQLKSGEAFDVTGTPTFILNGQKIKNPQSLEEFRQLLDQKLAETGQQ